MIRKSILSLSLIALTAIFLLGRAPTQVQNDDFTADDLSESIGGGDVQVDAIVEWPALSTGEAFVTETQAADGSRILTISANPVNYQAADGSWQPIKPRFEMVEGGFVNSSNRLKISATERQGTLRMQNGDAFVGWEPTSVALARSDGSEQLLAEPLADKAARGQLENDRRTILYTASWSLSSMREEVAALPGAAEHSLIFTERPRGDGKTLEMRVALHLLPGSALFAGGQRQTEAFSTDSEVEIRDTRGQTTLILGPVFAFEQADRSQQIRGRYHFTPLDAGTWKVAVETDWDWWTNESRVYPAVLDPVMYVKRSTEVAQIYGDQPNPCQVPYLSTDNPAPAVGIGQACSGSRALIRFNNLPTLPPGAKIQVVRLVVAPVRGIYHPIYSDKFPFASVDVEVRRLTGSWDPNTVTFQNAPLAYPVPIDGVKPLSFAPNWGGNSPNSWTIQVGATGLFTDWLNNPQGNFGLELRSANESECTENKCDYVAVPLSNSWDAPFPEEPFLIPSGGGFGLEIQYEAPELTAGQALIVDALPAGGDDYFATHHRYELPGTSSQWTAVAVKGLYQQPIAGGQETFATGYLDLSRYCGNSEQSGCSIVKSNYRDATYPNNLPTKDREANYVMIWGNPAANDQQIAVQPLDPLGNGSVEQYALQVSQSQPFPPIQKGGGMISHTLQISSTDIVGTFNLDIPADTRLLVDVQAYGHLEIESDTLNVPVPINSRLFYKPLSASYTGALEKNDGIEFAGNFVTVNDYKAAYWALALDYGGHFSQEFCYQDPETGEDICVYESVPLDITISVVACGLNATPTLEGCSIEKPPPAALGDCLAAGTCLIKEPFIIFSESGFDGKGQNGCHSDNCTRKKAADGQMYTAYITAYSAWQSGLKDRRVGVPANLPITIDYDSVSTLGDVQLTYFDSVDEPEIYRVGKSFFEGDLVNSDKRLSVNDLVALPLLPTDRSGTTAEIDTVTQQALYTTPLKRRVETSPGTLQEMNFTLAWNAKAEGHLFETNSVTAAIGNPTEAAVSSLSYEFGPTWTMDWEEATSSKFTNLRNSDGVAVQPEALGGAFRQTQTLILYDGQKLPGTETPCNGNCLDLRADNDTRQHANRAWKLPDITITGGAQTMQYSKPGELIVYSSDHPDSADNVSVPFSFQTFEGEVTVERGLCPGFDGLVTIVRGKSKIALPGLDNTGELVNVDFTLCESALRSAHLEFNAATATGGPGLPVGNTGIFVDFIKGDVTVAPGGDVEISFTADFKDGTGNVIDGEATVTLNTAGLFEISGKGQVLAKVNFNGEAWVAWNPLDVGVKVTAVYPGTFEQDIWFVRGDVSAHMWKGQGWQNKYHWLPDNNDTHFTGTISAKLRIKEGQAFSWWFIDIPPDDITFSIVVAFGEFCSNSDCNSYEWGIKGKFSVVGYDVGVYYGFESGFDFILGSDGHVLIDQYGSANNYAITLLAAEGHSAVPRINDREVAATLSRLTVADPTSSTVIQPITISPDAGSLLAGLTWARGNPKLTLIHPNGDEITPANVSVYDGEVHQEANAILYGFANPQAGQWQAKISNAAADNDYHFLYFANKRSPALTVTAPAAGNQTINNNETNYTVKWTPPTDVPAGVDLSVSLYYSVTNAATYTDTQPIGGVIRENISASDGQYVWDLSHLGNGTYQVYATLDNGQADINGEPIRPKLTRFGKDQTLGGNLFLAPGTLTIQETKAPAVPTNLILKPMELGALACWDPNPANDLAGYLLHYVTYASGGLAERVLRVHATIPKGSSEQQCVRVGGLQGFLNAEVAAYDANGNLSGYSVEASTAIDPDDSSHTPDPGELSLLYRDGVSQPCCLEWENSGPGGGGENLFWTTFTADGGFDHGVEKLAPKTTHTIGGIFPEGYIHWFTVQNFDGDGRVSNLSNTVCWAATDGLDDNGNGVPDDIEATYGTGDPDGDGLTVAEEYNCHSHPARADTDGDTFSDGEEVAGRSDPLDATSIPDPERIVNGEFAVPRLSLDADKVTFYAYTKGPNPAEQSVGFINEGTGVLNVGVAATEGWISPIVAPDYIAINIDKTGLSPGHHQGNIVVNGAPGTYTQDVPQTITVELWLMQGNPALWSLYLPLISNQ